MTEWPPRAGGSRQRYTWAAVVLLCVLPGTYLSLDRLAPGSAVTGVLEYAILFLAASSVGYLIGTAFSGEERAHG